jgi:osmotically inducible protein OsmC
MPQRQAEATWRGDLSSGSGEFSGESGNISGEYSFASRFESGDGTNPEELIASAHAACYSMALSNELDGAGYDPQRVSTTAIVNLNTEGEGPEIDTIELRSEAEVPEIDEDEFLDIANAAKEGCPVSKLYAGADISLDSQLVQKV